MFFVDISARINIESCSISQNKVCEDATVPEDVSLSVRSVPNPSWADPDNYKSAEKVNLVITTEKETMWLTVTIAELERALKACKA